MASSNTLWGITRTARQRGTRQPDPPCATRCSMQRRPHWPLWRRGTRPQRPRWPRTLPCLPGA
eukprot:9202836-Alexandrium_andersonii.AAC.1